MIETARPRERSFLLALDKHTGRERWRVPLGPIGASFPLVGWIVLRWGAEIAVRPLPPADRLRVLVAHRALRVPPADAGVLLALSTLPAVELARPQTWDTVDVVADALVAAINDC